MTETKSVQAGERTQHTVGPWIIHNTDVALEIHPAHDNDGLIVLADVYGENTNTGQANARLIAAAPELLSIAQLVDDMWENNGEPTNEHIALLKTAIAKAEGK